MSNLNDFVIKKGVLEKYTGNEEKVVIPGSVKEIGYRAFSGCSNLTSITIPDGVTKLDWGAFLGCSELEEINVTEGNADYCSDNGVLYDEDKSRLVQYPASKKETEFIIPEGVITIDHYAFSGCNNLTSITVPDSVWLWRDRDFSECSRLEEINVAKGNTQYYSEDGVLFTKDKKTIIKYPEGKKENEYKIPERVTKIVDSAFSKCRNLAKIVITENVSEIGYRAFEGSTGLVDITIPGGIKKWKDSTFKDCINVRKISVPDWILKSQKIIWWSKRFEKNVLAIYFLECMNKGLLAADDEKIEYIRKEKKDIIEIFILQDDAEMLMKYLELFDDISDKEIKKYISAAEKQNSEKVAYALKNPTDATEGGEKTEKVTAKAANDTKDIAEIYRIEEKVKILKDIPIPAEAKVFEKGIMYKGAISTKDCCSVDLIERICAEYIALWDLYKVLEHGDMNSFYQLKLPAYPKIPEGADELASVLDPELTSSCFEKLTGKKEYRMYMMLLLKYLINLN